MPGADGTFSPQAVGDRALRLSERMANITPVLEARAKALEARIATSFAEERSPAGEVWPDLKPATVAARIAKLKGASRRTRRTIAEKVGLARGQLTRRAQDIRNQALLVYANGGKNLPKLDDTGKMKRSIKVRAAKSSIVFTGRWPLYAHVKGVPSRNLPKRNSMPFEVAGNSRSVKLIADEDKALVDALHAYILHEKTP